MARATGYVPYARGVLYEGKAEGERLANIRLTNEDAGTDHSDVNVYFKPRDGTGSLLTPKNFQLGSGESYVIPPDEIPPFKLGDRIEGDCTSGTYLEFVIG